MLKFKLFALAVISGILLSFPWLFQGVGLVLFFAFYPLLFAEEQLIGQKETRFNVFFLLSFTTFFSWNLLSTWWIGHVSVSGMLLITLLNSLIMAFVWSLRHPIRQKIGRVSSYFALIVFWLSFEFIQHNSAIPWPWLTLGNGFANNVKIIQWYEFTGVLGGTVWVLLLNIMLFNASVNPTFSGKIKGFFLVVLTLILPILFSSFHYKNYKEKGDSLHVLVLQPNIDPFTEKFSGISPEKQIERLLLLASEKAADSIDLVVAPETAWLPFSEDSLLSPKNSLKRLGTILQNSTGKYFITGAITHRQSVELNEHPKTDFYNSAVFIDSEMKVQVSHKNILVNGVEQVPFQKYIPFLGRLLIDMGDGVGSLTPGDQPDLFPVSELDKVGSVICFESVFGEYVSRMANDGAGLFVVITNDGWWRNSSGVWQHFMYSRIRAIETRRAIVRSANTGISGFINQRGDVACRTKIGEIGAVKTSVRINDKITVYVQKGDYIGRISFAISVLLGCWLIFIRVVKRQKKSALIRL